MLNDDARYPIVIAGQSLAAVAQPLVMFTPTKLAGLWFSDSQRATANTLASMGKSADSANRRVLGLNTFATNKKNSSTLLSGPSKGIEFRHPVFTTKSTLQG